LLEDTAIVATFIAAMPVAHSTPMPVIALNQRMRP